jgi:tricorn protease
VWSPDSKKLAFTATVDGKKGTYTVEPPDSVKPQLLGSAMVTSAQWLKEGDQIVGLTEGKPVSLSAKGTVATRAFRAAHSVHRATQQRAIFDQCWQVMRDRYYDERLGNRDWDAVRAKYAGMAAAAPDLRTVQEVVQLMLGELNGSHLGFTLSTTATSATSWREETAHLGLRFDPRFAGPGWKVRDILHKGPASHKLSAIQAGEVVLEVDGQAVQPATDVSAVLNGPMERDIRLRVRAVDGKERDVTLRPISYSTARRLLYDQWIKENREAVEKASENRLGYLHISAMDDTSFFKFEEELYAAGAGKDGLVIDVRENGGGSTTDHLLTCLTQPRHAIAVPRGGRPGYPQDRMIYATWSKPIVVLCNQNSYSNAEVFSHAVKLLKRGPLVGVTTAGGVISTGATSIMDVGTLRLPFRGWYGLESGIDMELNGAVPDHLVWPQPGELSQGIDSQLEKAVEVLKTGVTTWKARPEPRLQKASERFKQP